MDNPSLIAFPSRPRLLGILVSIILGGGCYYTYAEDIQFNTDVLDVADRSNIDLDQFSRGSFIMPGEYNMKVRINKQELLEQPIAFYAPDDDPKGSEACITAAMVEQFAIKPALQDKLRWWHQDQCLVTSSLDGMTARAELGTSTLYVSLPQAYLEYSADNWDPPSRWDEGIPGLLVDYYLNGQTQRQQKQGTQNYNLSGNGTLGANMGAWRLRADWQARVEHQNGGSQSSQKRWDWNRYYAYRAVPSLGAKLTVGENSLYSDIFDSFRFAGVSLTSDDSMLPPNLRGYAPEVTGVARTNATVIISQQGRVLYETQVAAGPFRIQDINDAISGQLDVRVEELDGTVQQFKMDTASIPYLTRPGQVRYKVASGRPSDWQHRINGPLFATGEFSWGVSNGWSLYGGGVAGGDYNALAVGVGRDLLMFGALSVDVTQSRAQLPHSDGMLTGGSYRLSYSKRFDETDSQVTFAGYRFSQQDFLSMSEYLDARNSGERSGSNKEMYTVTFNQNLRDLKLSAYLNYSHQTYWDRPTNDRYTLTLAHNFDLDRFRNLSLSVTGYRNKYNNTNDDGVFLSLSMPWGNRGSLSYSGSYSRKENSNQVGYSDRLENGDSYQINSGWARSGASASGFYNHQGDSAQVSANANYQDGRYSSLSMSVQGGVTATVEGAAMHRSSMIGATRMLVDTDGVAGVPIRGYGGNTLSNRFGKAVVADVSNYYRNQVSIDLNALPDNAEATQSVVQATLTEGAIGYRRFAVIAGEKAMAVIRLADGSTPPFGATVLNIKQQEVGLVSDAGSVYLSGINPGEQMTVHWSGKPQCQLSLPSQIPNSGTTDLLLPCVSLPQTADLAAI